MAQREIELPTAKKKRGLAETLAETLPVRAASDVAVIGMPVKVDKTITEKKIEETEAKPVETAEPGLYGNTRPIRGAAALFLNRKDRRAAESRKAVLESAKLTGLPAEFIAASLLQEGYLLSMTTQRKEPLMSWALGMDSFYSDFKSGILQRYLPKDRQTEGDWYDKTLSDIVGRMTNEAGMKVTNVYFKTARDAILSFGAMLRTRYDRANRTRELAGDEKYIATYIYHNSRHPKEMVDAGKLEEKAKKALRPPHTWDRNGLPNLVKDPWFNAARVMATYHALEESGVFAPKPQTEENAIAQEKAR